MSNQLLNQQCVKLFHQVSDILEDAGDPEGGTWLLNHVLGNIICNIHKLSAKIHGCLPANKWVTGKRTLLRHKLCGGDQNISRLQNPNLCPLKDVALLTWDISTRWWCLLCFWLVKITSELPIFTWRALETALRDYKTFLDICSYGDNYKKNAYQCIRA